MYIISFVLPGPVTEDNCIVMVTRTDDVDNAGDTAKVSLDKYHQSWFQTIFIQSGLMQIVGDEQGAVVGAGAQYL